MRDSHGAAFLCLRLRNAAVGFRLIHHQLRADVAADIHVCNVDGENFVCRARVQAFGQHRAGNQIRILQHLLVGFRRADSGHDALADTRDNGFFARAADQTVDIRADGDARLGTQLNAVLRDCGDDGGFDDLRGDGHLHRLEHVTAREVNRARLLERHRDVRALRRNQGVNHAVHVAAGEEVRFQLGDVQPQTRLVRLNQRLHEAVRLDVANLHADERAHRHMHPAGQRGNPQSKRHERQEYAHHHKHYSDNTQNHCHIAIHVTILLTGALPLTLPEALPLNSTRDKGNGTKSPLDPFSRFSWLLLHAVSAC